MIAGIWIRVFAYVIDALLGAMFFGVLLFTVGTRTETVVQTAGGDTTWFGGIQLNGMQTLLFMLGWFVYLIGFEAAFGATIGKLVLGLRVVDGSGYPIGIVGAVARNLLLFLDALFFGLVGIVVMKLSAGRQRIGDHVAGSYVVHRNIAPKPLQADHQNQAWY